MSIKLTVIKMALCVKVKLMQVRLSFKLVLEVKTSCMAVCSVPMQVSAAQESILILPSRGSTSDRIGVQLLSCELYLRLLSKYPPPLKDYTASCAACNSTYNPRISSSFWYPDTY